MNFAMFLAGRIVMEALTLLCLPIILVIGLLAMVGLCCVGWYEGQRQAYARTKQNKRS